MYNILKIITLILLFCGVSLHAGDLIGKIYFSADKPKTATTGRYSHGSHQMKLASAIHDVRAVVYIAESFSDSTFKQPHSHPVMDQRNEQFVPYILPVLVGTTVDFPNNDKVYHNVFSFSKIKSFDLGKYPTKTFKKVTFDKSGVVTLYCEIHAHMNAFILVLPNPYFTSVQNDGAFLISEIPAGAYTVKLFSGREEELIQNIVIPEKGNVKVEFYR
jgi:plastocyanin